MVSPLHRPNRSPFDAIRHIDENSDGTQFEYWSARDAMEPLNYTEWRNMENVIRKAREACRLSGRDPNTHFVDANKMVDLGSGARRNVIDVQMTRYGMYLLALSGDSTKPEIAAAKTYFAVQTHRAEQQLPPIATPPASTEPPLCIQTALPWAHRLRLTDSFRRVNFRAGLRRDSFHRAKARTPSTPTFSVCPNWDSCTSDTRGADPGPA